VHWAPKKKDPLNQQASKPTDDALLISPTARHLPGYNNSSSGGSHNGMATDLIGLKTLQNPKGSN
jgi:hypothetical protein